MMRIPALALPMLLLAWACNPSAKEKNTQTDSSATTAVDTTQIHTTQPDLVEADEHSITDKSTLQKLYLLGKEVNCSYPAIPEQLKQQLPVIMQAISENKAVITGSYHIVLLENPDAAKATRIFIGIPVQKPLKAAGMSTFTIPAGKYLRHQCSAEPGKSLAIHRNVLNVPFKKLKQKAGFPIVEKYAEIRNDEMTSVISKATFYYTIAQ